MKRVVFPDWVFVAGSPVRVRSGRSEGRTGVVDVPLRRKRYGTGASRDHEMSDSKVSIKLDGGGRLFIEWTKLERVDP